MAARGFDKIEESEAVEKAQDYALSESKTVVMYLYKSTDHIFINYDVLSNL